jgi:hypothetical protein
MRTLADALSDLSAAVDALEIAVNGIPAGNTVTTVDSPAAVAALDAANLRIAAAIARIPKSPTQ